MAHPAHPRLLVGRTRELARLEAALARARAGRPGAVLLEGEAGIGKTRLLTELATRATDQGTLVLAGQCVDLRAASIPLLPVIDALSGLSGRDGELPPDVAGLVKGGPPWAAAAGDAAGPERTFAAVAELLAGVASREPVLLTLEDLHWADRSTLALVTFVLRRLHDERLLLVGTVRSDELDRHDDLRAFLADVAPAGVVERIELSRLSCAEAAEQVAALLGDTPAPGLKDAVLSRADGNPLFAEELVGLPANEAAQGLPPTLRDLLLTRLRRLGPAAGHAVGACSVAGRRVHHRLLAAATSIPEAELHAGLREAVRHQILVADGDGYAFRHPLLREVAYLELLPGERAALHARLADVLEREPALGGGNAATAAAELAHHAHHAGDARVALRASVAAGAEAERLRAPAEAADHYGRALALWEAVAEPAQLAGQDRVALTTRAAEAAASSGRYGSATLLADAALALVDEEAEPLRAARLHERRGWYLWYDGRGREAVPAYERAVALFPSAPPSAGRAGTVARLGLLLVIAGDRMDLARARCEEAVVAARAAGARAEEAEAALALGLALEVAGDRPGALTQLRHAWEAGRQHATPTVQARAAGSLSHVLRRAGEYEAAIDVAFEGADVCHRAGLDLAEGGLCQANAAEAAFDAGRWELVERLTAQQLARGATGIMRVWALMNQARLDLARGDFGEAEVLAAKQRALEGEAVPERVMDVAEQAAEIALWRGEPDVALARAQEGIAAAPSEPAVPAGLVALAVRAAADVAVLARDRRDDTAAATAVATARELGRRIPAGPAEDPALAATIAAEVARAVAPADPAPWAAAGAICSERGSPHRAAYARWRQAEALLAARAPRAEVAGVLREAHATAAAMGAAPLAAEVAALGRRARIALDVAEPPAPPASEGPFGLTAREREVVEQLALGRTNRQIAEGLFISPRTVGVHVAHILGKLGAATRGEAVAVARRQGLL